MPISFLFPTVVCHTFGPCLGCLVSSGGPDEDEDEDERNLTFVAGINLDWTAFEANGEVWMWNAVALRTLRQSLLRTPMLRH